MSTVRMVSQDRVYAFDSPLPSVTYVRPPRPVCHDNVSITLKDRPAFYTKDATISGTVTLKCPKDQKIKSLKVVLEAWCRSEGIAQHPDGALQDDWLAFYENHRIVYQENVLFPPENVSMVKKSETTFKTPKGVYDYDFRFMFPAHCQCGEESTPPHGQHPLPLTYRMKYITTEVEIDYRIKVYVERAGFMTKDWFVMEPVPYLPLGPSPSQVIAMSQDKIKLTSDLIAISIPREGILALDKELHGIYAPESLQQASFYLGCWFPQRLVPGTVPDFKLFILSTHSFPSPTKVQLISLSLGLCTTFRFRAQSLGTNGHRDISNDVDFYKLNQPITIDLAGLHPDQIGLGELPFMSAAEPLDYALDLTPCLKRTVELVNVEPTFRTCAFEVSHKVKMSYTFRSTVDGVPLPIKSMAFSQQVEVTSRSMSKGWSTDEIEQLPQYKKELSPAPAFED